MQATWDILARDLRDVPWYAFLSMMSLAVTVPISGMAAGLGTILARPRAWRNAFRAALRGTATGTIVFLFGWLFILVSRQWPGIARELDQSWPEIGALLVGGWAVLTAMAAFAESWRLASDPAVRFWAWPNGWRISLREMLIAQALVATLLTWWIATRGDAIQERQTQFDQWERRLAAEAALRPYGWNVSLNPDDGELCLHLPPDKSFRSQPGVSDATLDVVAQFQPIKILHLQSDGISDAGINKLSRLKGLELLWLGSNEISDEGLAGLAEAQQLKGLGIRSNRLTDRSLDHLSALRNLERLTILNAGTTPAGEAKFRRERPHVRFTGSVPVPQVECCVVPTSTGSGP